MEKYLKEALKKLDKNLEKYEIVASIKKRRLIHF